MACGDRKHPAKELAKKMNDKGFVNYVNECLKNMEYVEGVDYGQVLRIRRQQMTRYKGSKNSWFGGQ